MAGDVSPQTNKHPITMDQSRLGHSTMSLIFAHADLLNPDRDLHRIESTSTGSLRFRKKVAQKQIHSTHGR